MPLPAALVLLNGPPRCGKDTAAAHLRARSGGLVERRGMADPLKRATHAAYGLFCPAGRPLAHDAFERVKDKPRDEFFGLTPRQAYIAHSEAYMKPQHGPDVFGRLFRRDLPAAEAPVVAVPDSGFAAEAWPTIEDLGRDRVLLVRIFASRRGCTFAGDSRSHIDLPGVWSVNLNNDRDPAAFLELLTSVVARFLDTVPNVEAVVDGLRAPLAERAFA